MASWMVAGCGTIIHFPEGDGCMEMAPADSRLRFRYAIASTEGRAASGSSISEYATRTYTRRDGGRLGFTDSSETGGGVRADSAYIPVIEYRSIPAFAEILMSDSMPVPLFLRGCLPDQDDFEQIGEHNVYYRSDKATIAMRIERSDGRKGDRWDIEWDPRSGLLRIITRTRNGSGAADFYFHAFQKELSRD